MAKNKITLGQKLILLSLIMAISLFYGGYFSTQSILSTTDVSDINTVESMIVGGGGGNGGEFSKVVDRQQDSILSTQSIIKLDQESKKDSNVFESVYSFFRRALRMTEIGTQSVWFCGTDEWCQKQGSELGDCRIVNNCIGSVDYLFCGPDNTDSKIDEVCSKDEKEYKEPDYDFEMSDGNCNDPNYEFCYQSTGSYGPATAYAKTLQSYSNDNRIINYDGKAVFFPGHEILRQCQGDIAYYLVSNSPNTIDNNWWNSHCGGSGCSGARVIPKGDYFISKDDFDSWPRDGDYAYIYFICWDRDDRSGYWSWVAHSVWTARRFDQFDIAECADENNCGSSQICQSGSCVDVECKINSDCGSGSCYDNECRYNVQRTNLVDVSGNKVNPGETFTSSVDVPLSDVVSGSVVRVSVDAIGTDNESNSQTKTFNLYFTVE